jgi:regulatory protein
MPAGTITALRAQAHDSQRVNIFIDGAFALGVSLTTLSKARLYVGKTLTDEEFARLEHAEQGSKAYQAALRLLEARPRSTAELRDRLRRKEFAPEAIDQAVERLEELGLLDDRAFARMWVENRQAYRPRGPAALRNELQRKGVDRAVVDQVLSNEALTGDQSAHAAELARSVVHKYAHADSRATFMRRLGGFLQRRGFDFETIRPIIDQLWNELEQSAENEEQGDGDEV